MGCLCGRAEKQIEFQPLATGTQTPTGVGGVNTLDAQDWSIPQIVQSYQMLMEQTRMEVLCSEDEKNHNLELHLGKWLCRFFQNMHTVTTTMQHKLATALVFLSPDCREAPHHQVIARQSIKTWFANEHTREEMKAYVKNKSQQFAQELGLSASASAQPSLFVERLVELTWQITICQPSVRIVCVFPDNANDNQKKAEKAWSYHWQSTPQTNNNTPNVLYVYSACFF
jgi:hypothetical protein